MQKFRFLVRRVDCAGHPVTIDEGEIEGSRTAVAVKRAAEALPDKAHPGEWLHVSVQRIQ